MFSQARTAFMLKARQLYEMVLVRHGLMVVGLSYGAKTALYKVLAAALGDLEAQGLMGEHKVQVSGGARAFGMVSSWADAALSALQPRHLLFTVGSWLVAGAHPRTPTHVHLNRLAIRCGASTPRPSHWASCTASLTPSATSGTTACWPRPSGEERACGAQSIGHDLLGTGSIAGARVGFRSALGRPLS